MLAHYASQPIRLVLELDALHMLAETLLKANGHMETVSTGLLLDEPFATQMREAMALCVHRSFVRVEDARPLSRSNTRRGGRARPPSAGLPTIAGANAPSAASSPRDGDDDTTSDSMSDSDEDAQDRLRRKRRALQRATQPAAAKNEQPPRHYDGLCREYAYVLALVACTLLDCLCAWLLCSRACCFFVDVS